MMHPHDEQQHQQRGGGEGNENNRLRRHYYTRRVSGSSSYLTPGILIGVNRISKILYAMLICLSFVILISSLVQFNMFIGLNQTHYYNSLLDNYNNENSNSNSNHKRRITRRQKVRHHQVQQQHHTNVSNIKPNSPYAYAFLLGSIDLHDKNKPYRRYLCGTLIAIHLLRSYGSTADIVFYYGMKYHKHSNTDYDDLPIAELNALQHYPGVHLVKIPTSPNLRTFYNLNLNKFRVLGLVQYQRVLYLDTDVMPLANLDYLFELSTNGTLKPNVVMRGMLEPTNGGFIMVAPQPGDLELAQSIINEKEHRMPNPRFDATLGWGKRLIKQFECLRFSGYGWHWYGSSGDQGLLYHWMYHIKRDFSLIIPNDEVGYNPIVENYSPSIGTEDEPVYVDRKFTLQSQLLRQQQQQQQQHRRPKHPHPHPPVIPSPQQQQDMVEWGINATHPFPDIIHFVGRWRKPWSVYRGWELDPQSKYDSSNDYWWVSLLEASNTVGNIGFDIESVQTPIVHRDQIPQNDAGQGEAMINKLFTNLLE